MKIDLSARAEQDLNEIFDYLAEIDVNAAHDLNAQFALRLDQVAQLPKMGRTRSDIHEGLRSLLVSPYILFHRIMEDKIVIVRVLHGHRDLRASMIEEQ